VLGEVVRLSPDIRGVLGKLFKKGLTVTRIAWLFDPTRHIVHRWLKRPKHVGREYFNDKPGELKVSKVTAEVEVSILTLRNTFRWGTARTLQGLYNLTDLIEESLHCLQGAWLSGETINNVLIEHGINRYPRNYKRWKFFRAKEHNELWQIDFNCPFMCMVRSTGSSYALTTTVDFWRMLDSLTCIESLNREFVNHLRKFLGWLDDRQPGEDNERILGNEKSLL